MPLNNINRGHVTDSFRFDIPQLLESIAGYKGLPLPTALLGWSNAKTGSASGQAYQVEAAPGRQTYADNGALLRRYDLMGGYYFMPVSFVAEGKEHEIDCALVSIHLKKTVVETPLVGRRGNVKELINLEGLKISVTGCLISKEKGIWPERRINDLWNLFQLNDSISIKCALTDCFFNDEDKVIITDLSFPSPNNVEDVVPVSLQCESDQVFELKID